MVALLRILANLIANLVVFFLPELMLMVTAVGPWRILTERGGAKWVGPLVALGLMLFD